MMKKRHFGLITTLIFWGCGIVLFSAAPVGQCSNDSEKLKRYTSCRFDNDLYIKEVARRDKSAENHRTVKTSAGEKKVSVVDGYRVMYAYQKARYYFANVKIEQSNVQDYANDKETVIEQIKYLPFYDTPIKMVFRGNQSLNGFEVYGADMDVIDKGGVIGIYVIFSDADNVVITIYFLNQGREHRRYNNIDEFRSVRDDFLQRYTRCIADSRSD